MEVHHHPHVEKKNFKEYFFEFLMIFLAVTMGFFAENIREHFSDKSKEKEYMQSLIQDLKKDTAELREVTGFWNNHMLEIDSLSNALKQPITQENIAELLRLTYKFYKYDDIHYHNTTVEQLQNAGLFRIVSNKEIADKITSYDKIYTDELKEQRDAFKQTFIELTGLLPQLVNYNMMPLNPFWGGENFYKGAQLSTSLVSNDTKLISLIQGKMYNLRFSSFLIIYNETDLLKQATVLIKLVNKKYDMNE